MDVHLSEYLIINDATKKAIPQGRMFVRPMGGGASGTIFEEMRTKEIVNLWGHQRFLPVIDPKKVIFHHIRWLCAHRNNGRDLKENKFRCVENATRALLHNFTIPHEIGRNG
jgi:hypothetical protein